MIIIGWTILTYHNTIYKISLTHSMLDRHTVLNALVCMTPEATSISKRN